jgi:hypothetical protein
MASTSEGREATLTRCEVTTADLRVACEQLLEEVVSWRSERKAFLAQRSRELGFEFTDEHLRIEQAVDLLERRTPSKPGPRKLTLIEGGRS